MESVWRSVCRRRRRSGVLTRRGKGLGEGMVMENERKKTIIMERKWRKR